MTVALSDDDRAARARFGYLFIIVVCLYWFWQAAELTTREPGGPMAVFGEMGKYVVFVWTVLPAIAIWILGHLWTRSVMRFRAGLYLATFFAVLLAVRTNLSYAPGYPEDYYSYGVATTIAAWFKGIVAPPGTTSEEPGDYFPASEESVDFFLGLGLLLLALAVGDIWKISPRKGASTEFKR